LMGWNKQSGEAWVLQRTVMLDGSEPPDKKALALTVRSLLTIEDADRLRQALEDEVEAARRSER
jgi:hypothetical protein